MIKMEIISIIFEFFSAILFEGLFKGIRNLNSFIKRKAKRVFCSQKILLIYLLLLFGCNSSQTTSDSISADSTLLLMHTCIYNAEILYDSALSDFHAGKSKDMIIEKYESRINQTEIDAQYYFEQARNQALEGKMNRKEFFRIVNELKSDSLQQKIKVLSDLGISFSE